MHAWAIGLDSSKAVGFTERCATCPAIPVPSTMGPPMAP